MSRKTRTPAWGRATSSAAMRRMKGPSPCVGRGPDDRSAGWLALSIPSRWFLGAICRGRRFTEPDIPWSVMSMRKPIHPRLIPTWTEPPAMALSSSAVSSRMSCAVFIAGSLQRAGPADADPGRIEPWGGRGDRVERSDGRQLDAAVDHTAGDEVEFAVVEAAQVGQTQRTGSWSLDLPRVDLCGGGGR